jgi:hypothetical protein
MRKCYNPKTKYIGIHREKRMEVLWAAWVKDVHFTEEQYYPIDIIGIYEDIWREGRKDFPFVVSLQVIIAFQSYLSESNREFTMTLEMVGMAGQAIFSEEWQLTMPETADALIQWYENYKFDNVKIEEPGYYQLSILINGEVKRIAPLHVIAPKVMIYDPVKDSTTELWPEDWNPET